MQWVSLKYFVPEAGLLISPFVDAQNYFITWNINLIIWIKKKKEK